MNVKQCSTRNADKIGYLVYLLVAVSGITGLVLGTGLTLGLSEGVGFTDGEELGDADGEAEPLALGLSHGPM